MPMQLAIRDESRPARERQLVVELATSAGDIEAAQRLRYRVFCGEMGARIATSIPGRDEDAFDPWCEHLVVRDRSSDAIVCTYRILTSEGASRIGSFYADTEFDLAPLAGLKSSLVEVGRACVHPEYRSGTTLTLLWQGLASFMRVRGHRHLIGCASISLHDGGGNALAIWRDVAPAYLAPTQYRVHPRRRLVPPHAAGSHGAQGSAIAAVPPLLRAYLRMGAWICGEPSWDPDFNTADMFQLLPLARLEHRFARRYLAAA
jgi:putative hemolysin